MDVAGYRFGLESAREELLDSCIERNDRFLTLLARS